MFHADVPSRQGCQGFPFQAIDPIHSHPQQLRGPNPDAQQPLFTLWITRPGELYPNRPSEMRSNLGANSSPQSAPPHSMLPYRAVAYRLREDTRIGKVSSVMPVFLPYRVKAADYPASLFPGVDQHQGFEEMPRGGPTLRKISCNHVDVLAIPWCS
ncbi:hypothetical protein XPA_002729 [Xanthoria parietina]